MNQQFDLQNITDAVLKAVKSTGQEENVSAENIAKQVAEILKNNNTQISTLDSSDSLKDERNDVAEEPKSLGGSFTLEEPPKAVEEVDTREINVPLNGSFGIKHRTINKDRASMVAAAAANKKVNSKNDTNKTAAKGSDEVINNKANDVKNIADEKKVVQTESTAKPTEKTTVGKNSNDTVAKPGENKPVDTAVDKNKTVEEPKSLGGSFTLEEPPKAVEEFDTREINVPLNGSFSIKHRTINEDRASMIAAAAANKKVNAQDDTNKTVARGVDIDKVTDNKAYDVKNIADNKKAAQSESTTKPTEKTTVGKDSNDTVAKPVENKPVNTTIDKNKPSEEPKSLGGSFTLEEPPKAIEEVDTREINVPLNGSFSIKHRTINKDRASMVAAAAANKKANAQDDNNKIAAKSSNKIIDNKTDDVKNITDSKKDVQAESTAKPTEKTTVGKQNNTTIAKPAENKPVDTAVSKNKPAEEPKSLGGSFTLEEPPKAVEEVDTREINVPLNGSFGIKQKSESKNTDNISTTATTSNKKVNTKNNANKTAAKNSDKVINNKANDVKNIANNKNVAQTESTAKPTKKTTVGKDSNATVAKPAENKPVNTAVNKNKPAEEPKSLGGSFTLEEPPKDVEEVDTREINVPLNGSFSIKHRTINKDRASMVAAAAANKKVNAQDDTNKTAAKSSDEVIDNKANDVKNIADSKKAVQAESTAKPTEKTTVNKKSNATVAKPVENKPVNTAVDKNKPVEEPKSLGGSFTLEEPPKAVEEVDTREINVPLNGSFGIKQKSESKNTDNITTATTSANKKVNTKNDTNKTAAKNSDEVINNKANNVKNIADSKKAVQAESTAKPTEKTTVNKKSNATVTKPAKNKPVDTAVSKNKPVEEPKSLGGSFTLEEPPKAVEEVDTREINVPLNGSFGIESTVSEEVKPTTGGNKKSNSTTNKTKKSTAKTKMSTAPINNNVKIDVDDSVILEAAKKIISDYITTEEFANKLKEILK